MSYISPSVQAVIDLFQGPLAEVRFADVDVSALASLAAAAEAAATELAEHEMRLSELRQVLTDRQEALLLLAQRGLAYARVYAEQDDALTEQLSRINLPKPSKPRKASAKPVSAEPVSAEPVSAEPPSAEVGATPGSDVSAELSAEHPSNSAPLLDVSNADEPARDESPVEEPAAAMKPAKGKRRGPASRDEAQSRPG